MMFPIPTAPHQAGFAAAGLRPGPYDDWLGLDTWNMDAPSQPRPTASIVKLGGRTRPASQPGAGSALTVLPRHRLTTGVLCGAQIAPASPQAGGGPVQCAWLLRAACQEAQAWRATEASETECTVTVALPEHAAHSGTLRAQARAALATARLPARLLEIAFAAPDLVEAGPEVLLLVSSLHDFGIGVSMDGLDGRPASMRALRSLPLTGMRLAASLTGEVARSAEARDAVFQAVHLAHRFGARVSAVDVRTALQRDVLADLGCDDAQGPIFADLLPPAAFRRALTGLLERQTGH